ncbi:MAG TPA: S-methyl-5'-thioadenosine phosphorylase [Jiangellaceae bacterium]|nr:S-methyl-5'-thioadenosine phosphorylase [Jiangellaceae bacterium]
MDTPGARADVGVIGGSGLYSLVDDAHEVDVDTPFGRPSDAVTVGRVGDRQVAFLPRHGRDHRHPPHAIPYRANLWALRSLGVRQIVAPCAVGSLRPELGPGTFVVPDQLVDRTAGRVQTFYDQGAVHVPFADPYCPAGRAAVVEQARAAGLDPVDGGTMVVVDGPRFSTRAESRWYAAQGWSLVNMTGHPEAVLARELALCFTAVALVTDLDAGVAVGDTVTQAEVFRVFAENIERMRELALRTVAALDLDRQCPCSHALDGIAVPLDLP